MTGAVGAASGGVTSPLQGLRVLVVSPIPTHPTTAGNRARVLALLDRLQALGASVRLLHVAHEAGDNVAMENHWTKAGFRSVSFAYPPPRHRKWNRWVEVLARRFQIKLPYRVDVDDWYDRSLEAVVQEEVQRFQPQAVMMQYIWFSALLDALPKSILRVLDAQDVFSNRNERLRAAGVEQEWFSVSPREEARALKRFNVIMAIQDKEAAYYASITAREVVTVGHFLKLVDTGLPSRAPNLLIVGSDNTINIDGVRWFLEEVWPSVLSSCPGAMLNIVGRVAESVTPAPNVVTSGPVLHLDAAYEAARVVITPLRGGTGLKIKSAEALGAGRVVVSTVSAAEGLETAIGRGLVVADNASAMAREIVALLNDDTTVDRLSAEARRFAMEWNAQQGRTFDEVFARAL